ncbi:uncharacterized protein LOC106478607 [Limulus polyphemus]|uniref:Uncharacterized protein LOC106478607 n=1 Tax=Limulus polyphemus TaxID=6850 RepID=A0ABM1C5K6_LIMPO|nr:uncharacterized protein LOC106478607 [Limulus polyphemus]
MKWLTMSKITCERCRKLLSNTRPNSSKDSGIYTVPVCCCEVSPNSFGTIGQVSLDVHSCPGAHNPSYRYSQSSFPSINKSISASLNASSATSSPARLRKQSCWAWTLLIGEPKTTTCRRKGFAVLIALLLLVGAGLIAGLYFIVDHAKSFQREGHYGHLKQTFLRTVDGEFKVTNREFIPQLTNNFSLPYLMMEREILYSIDRLFEQTPLAEIYNRTVIMKFRPGSVTVNCRVFFNTLLQNGTEDVGQAFRQVLKRSNGYLPGRLLKVHIESVIFRPSATWSLWSQWSSCLHNNHCDPNITRKRSRHCQSAFGKEMVLSNEACKWQGGFSVEEHECVCHPSDVSTEWLPKTINANTLYSITSPNSVTTTETTTVNQSSTTKLQTPTTIQSYTKFWITTTARSPTSTQSSTTTRSPTSTQSSTTIRSPTSTQSSTTIRSPTSTQSSTTIRSPASTQSSTTIRSPASTQSSTTTRPPTNTQFSTTQTSTAIHISTAPDTVSVPPVTTTKGTTRLNPMPSTLNKPSDNSAVNNRRPCHKCSTGEICLLRPGEIVPYCIAVRETGSSKDCGGWCNGSFELCKKLDNITYQCIDQTECLFNEWKCGNGLCIPEERRCDGHFNCYDDTDELDCVCSKQEFHCGNWTSCIKLSQRCDGNYDCWDGTDEINCFSACSSTEFTCMNGQCIPTNQVCDSYNDCDDQSDEPNGCNSQCTENEHQCTNGRCIAHSGLCDGIDNCGDNSDEYDCGKVFPHLQF